MNSFDVMINDEYFELLLSHFNKECVYIWNNSIKSSILNMTELKYLSKDNTFSEAYSEFASKCILLINETISALGKFNSFLSSKSEFKHLEDYQYYNVSELIDLAKFTFGNECPDTKIRMSPWTILGLVIKNNCDMSVNLISLLRMSIKENSLLALKNLLDNITNDELLSKNISILKFLIKMLFELDHRLTRFEDPNEIEYYLTVLSELVFLPQISSSQYIKLAEIFPKFTAIIYSNFFINSDFSFSNRSSITFGYQLAMCLLIFEDAFNYPNLVIDCINCLTVDFLKTNYQHSNLIFDAFKLTSKITCNSHYDFVTHWLELALKFNVSKFDEDSLVACI